MPNIHIIFLLRLLDNLQLKTSSEPKTKRFQYSSVEQRDVESLRETETGHKAMFGLRFFSNCRERLQKAFHECWDIYVSILYT